MNEPIPPSVEGIARMTAASLSHEERTQVRALLDARYSFTSAHFTVWMKRVGPAAVDKWAQARNAYVLLKEPRTLSDADAPK